MASNTTFNGEPLKCGHTLRYIKRPWQCVECNRTKLQKWMEKNGGRATVQRAWRDRDILRSKIVNIRAGAKKRGIDFSITEKDLSLDDDCPSCGVAYESGIDAYSKGTARSVDRIDNDIGYVPGNVFIICRRCNTMKSNGTLEQLKSLVRWWENHLVKIKDAAD